MCASRGQMMADRATRTRRCDVSRYVGVAAAVLLGAAATNMGWRAWPDETSGYIFVGCCASFSILLALLVMNAYRVFWVALACGLTIGYMLQVAWCQFAFVVAPWPLRKNEPICSDGVGGYLTVAGLAAALWLAVKLLDVLTTARAR